MSKDNNRVSYNIVTTIRVSLIDHETSSISRANASPQVMSMNNNVIIPPSPSPLTMVVAAINNSVTISTDSSMAITSAVVTTTLKPNRNVYNSTGYLVEQDELEYSILAAFSDMQTVLLACISTLLPLIIAVAIAFGVRHAWRKYRHRRNGMSDLPWYTGVSSREDTAESLHNCPNSARIGSQPASRILSAHDLANDINGPRYIRETEVIEEVALMIGDGDFASPVNHTSKNANGNIITLTLKNNHLIVETEERMVSMEDNSFVVEMEPKYTRSDINIITRSIDDATEKLTDQQALVHQEKIADSSTEFGTTKLFGSINTGLSQSDLSVSSHGSTNRCYCYGNQMEYETDQFGYSSDPGTNKYNDTISYKPDTDFKWKQFEDTPDAAGTLLNGMENSGSGRNITHNGWKHASKPSEILGHDHNRQVNGVTPNKFVNTTLEGVIKDCSTCKCEKPVITVALLRDEIQQTPAPSERQSCQQSESSQKQSNNFNEASLSLERKLCNASEQKLEISEFVLSHQRSGSISPRVSEENPNIDETEGIDIHNQLRTKLLPALSPKFELTHEEVGLIDGDDKRLSEEAYQE